MTNKHPEYMIEAISKHQGTLAITLQYQVKWLCDPELDWYLLANLKDGCRDLLWHYHEKQGLLVYRWILEG